MTSRPLSADEGRAVRDWLPDRLEQLFFDQPDEDQRHGYHSALRLVAAGERDPDLLIAALVHDVGKRHSGLGVLGRSLASLMPGPLLRRYPRLAAYRNHGPLGAADLVEAGAPLLAVDYAASHHGPRPDGIHPRAWAALNAADEPAKARMPARPR